MIIRSFCQTVKDYKNIEWLKQKYLVEKLSAYEIADLSDCNAHNIYYWLKKHNIKIRSLQETLNEREKLYGYKRTDKTLEKMSINCKKFYGEENYFFGKSGSLSPWFGIKRSKEHCEKLSKAITGTRRPDIIGEKNHNWKGGKTPLILSIRNSPKNISWRNEIFARDNYNCQYCKNIKKHNINAHHIKELSCLVHENKINSLEEAYECDLFWDINNGITLCEECHKLVHKKRKK